MSSSHSSRFGYVMLLARLVQSDYEQTRPIAERVMQVVEKVGEAEIGRELKMGKLQSWRG